MTFVIPKAVLPANGAQRSFQICEVRRDLDVRVWTDTIPRDRPVLLPAGDYAFAYRHRDGDVRFVRFTARSGAGTVITAQ